MATPKKETVSVETFRKWPFSKHFSYDVTEDRKVDNVKCITCSSNWTSIKQEAKRRHLRGASLVSLKQYVDGIHYVHRSNLERHCNSAYHQLSDPSSSDMSSEKSRPTHQPRIDVSIINTNKSMYGGYFRTALFIAQQELPIVKFEKLVDLQRSNGLNLPQNSSRQRAKLMIEILAGTVREDISKIMSEVNFMSALSDGSEARKTREEKELVYTKLVRHGIPVTLFLKCQRMIDFGGTDAAAVLKAVRGAFVEFGLDISANGRDKTKLVSVCADGASTNMGCKSGAMIVLQRDIPWLVIIHCSLHKLELAVKDGFKAAKDFEEIDNQLISLFKTFKDSGKCWRILLLISERLGVTIRRFVKSQGTRFQAHKKNALDVLIYNFCVLLLFAENATTTTKLLTPGMKTRFEGFRKKWIQYDFPVRIMFYRQVLDATSKLSLFIERDDFLITDVMDALEDCSDCLETMLEEKFQPPEVLGVFECRTVEEEDSVLLKVKATSMPSTLSLGDRSKLSENQKRSLEKHIKVEISSSQEFKLTQVRHGNQAISRIQNNLIPEIKKCIDNRFYTFKADNLLQSMRIVDHTTWDYSDKAYGNGAIEKIYEHYQKSLTHKEFSIGNALEEWKQLKKRVKRKYPTIKDKLFLWQKVYANEKKDLHNILLIIEICLAIAVAQGMVERGFSLTRRLMTDSRTRLKNSTLDDLLMLKLNVPILSKLDPSYEQTLITKSVETYMAKRRWSPSTHVTFKRAPSKKVCATQAKRQKKPNRQDSDTVVSSSDASQSDNESDTLSDSDANDESEMDSYRVIDSDSDCYSVDSFWANDSCPGCSTDEGDDRDDDPVDNLMEEVIHNDAIVGDEETNRSF